VPLRGDRSGRVGARGMSLRDAQEFVAVSLKIGLRDWVLIFATACVTVSLFYSAQGVLFNGSRTSIFEGPFGVTASLLLTWGADARMDRTQAKWILAVAIVVSLLLLGMLVALPAPSPAVRFLLTAAAVTVSVAAIFKLLGRL
jgi:hypothetical protein